MPTDSAMRFLLVTYDLDAGSSPTSTTASHGMTPRVARRRLAPSRTWASTFCWTGLPSRIMCGSCTPARATTPDVPSRRDAQASDLGGAPRVGVDGDDHAVQGGRALGGLEANGHLVEEALKDQVAVHADEDRKSVV